MKPRDFTEEELTHITGEQCYNYCIRKHSEESRVKLAAMLLGGVSSGWIMKDRDGADGLPPNIKCAVIRGLEYYRQLLIWALAAKNPALARFLLMKPRRRV